MNDKKQKTPIIAKVYVLLTVSFIILSVSLLGFFYLTLLGLAIVIYSTYLAVQYKHVSAIKSGIIGQAMIVFLLGGFLITPQTIPLADFIIVYSVGAFIGIIICFSEIFVIYPLLFMYRKEEKVIEREKEKRYLVLVNLKQYLQEKKIARQESKQKTPIINRYYILLTTFFIIWGLIVIPIYIFAFWGVPFVIISIYLARKFKHLYAIMSGLIGQGIIILIFSLGMGLINPYNPYIFQWQPIVFRLIGIIISLLEISVIYPLLFIYRKEERVKIEIETARFQHGKMTQDQAISYLKELSAVYDSIILNEISVKTSWEVKELIELIETLIFNGELTAEISDDKLIFDREALIALKDAGEVKNTELDDVEAETTLEEILPIKDKKGKTMKNVVSVDDIEKVLTPGELKELQQTEAEMGIEEMQINCIVHKGPVEGTNVYICPKCKTFYCVRCAKAVKKSGEKCWTCRSELTL